MKIGVAEHWLTPPDTDETVPGQTVTPSGTVLFVVPLILQAVKGCSSQPE